MMCDITWYIYKCIHTHVCIYVYIYIHTYTPIESRHVSPKRFAYMFTYHKYMYTLMCQINIHVYFNTFMHMYTCWCILEFYTGLCIIRVYMLWISHASSVVLIRASSFSTLQRVTWHMCIHHVTYICMGHLIHANGPWLTSSAPRGLLRVLPHIFEWVMSRMKLHESWLQISHDCK